MEGGRLLGFEFVSRDRTSLTVRMHGHEVSPSYADTAVPFGSAHVEDNPHLQNESFCEE